MKSLYEISKEATHLMLQIEEAEGELTPEVEKALTINQNELKTKGVNYGLVVLNIQSEIDAIDHHIERLTQRKKAKLKHIEQLETRLKDAMDLYNITEVSDPLVTIKVLKNPASIEIVNSAQVPAKFKKTKTTTTTTIDKQALKTALKIAKDTGESIPGAILIEDNTRLKIK